LVLWAKIVLLAAAGKLNQEIARELKAGMKTVCQWRNRFAKRGLAGLEKDAPRGEAARCRHCGAGRRDHSQDSRPKSRPRPRLGAGERWRPN
jgi:hypothetical protein